MDKFNSLIEKEVLTLRLNTVCTCTNSTLLLKNMIESHYVIN